ncbi:MAG: T9SS type A sorting domain-containing protein [Prolixibacteraceae bacterium]
MKTKYLFILATTIVLFLRTTSMYAVTDSTYVYTYDSSGNRTERVINFNKSARIDSNLSTITEELGELSIKIYPNPTKGILKVELTGNNNEEDTRLIIYNANGSQIINKQIPNNLEMVNLSGFPTGIYILKIVVGQNISEWKILKD